MYGSRTSFVNKFEFVVHCALENWWSIDHPQGSANEGSYRPDIVFRNVAGTRIVRYLSLASCIPSAGPIPPALGELTALVDLKLHGNKLNGEGNQRWPFDHPVPPSANMCFCKGLSIICTSIADWTGLLQSKCPHSEVDGRYLDSTECISFQGCIYPSID